MSIEGEAALTLHAGDPFLMPPGTPHNARDLGPGTGMMLSTYIVRSRAVTGHVRTRAVMRRVSPSAAPPRVEG
jgi:mannose-6-phosphate isomerase-like protein (cupin superfamily)